MVHLTNFSFEFLCDFHTRCLSGFSIPWCKKVKNDQKLKSRGSCLKLHGVLMNKTKMFSLIFSRQRTDSSFFCIVFFFFFFFFGKTEFLLQAGRVPVPPNATASQTRGGAEDGSRLSPGVFGSHGK